MWKIKFENNVVKLFEKLDKTTQNQIIKYFNKITKSNMKIQNLMENCLWQIKKDYGDIELVIIELSVK